MEFIEMIFEEIWEHRRKLWVIAFVLFLFQVHYAYAYDDIPIKIGETTQVSDDILLDNITTKEDEKDEVSNIKDIYYVDIKGEVKKPGVYKLESGKRVFDAISLAGGVLKDGDTSLINLSMKIEDEMVIYVRNKKEVDICNDVILNDAVINKEESRKDNQKVNINSADKNTLMTIPLIGEGKAEAIIEYRKKNGNFKTIEDIKNVSGIGDAIFQEIKEYITIK